MTREEFEATPDTGDGVLVRYTNTLLDAVGPDAVTEHSRLRRAGTCRRSNGTTAVVEWKMKDGTFEVRECHANNIELANGPRKTRRKASRRQGEAK